MSEWNEWSQHVLKELERLNSCVTALDEKVDKIIIGQAVLKTKIAIWGGIGGLIGGAIISAVVKKLL